MKNSVSSFLLMALNPEIFSKCSVSDGENKQVCADVISCLSMVMSEKRECLKYRLVGSDEDIGDWGHEYVRHLAGEVGAEWNDKVTENPEYDTR